MNNKNERISQMVDYVKHECEGVARKKNWAWKSKHNSYWCRDLHLNGKERGTQQGNRSKMRT